jgi:hypothetical protein
MGLLAELLVRTYHESQNRPTYVIKEILEALGLPEDVDLEELESVSLPKPPVAHGKGLAQQRTAEALTAFVGYDDPEHFWNGSLGAWAIVQNGWPWSSRKFNVTWNLLNRNGDAVAGGVVCLMAIPVAWGLQRWGYPFMGRALSRLPWPFVAKVLALQRREEATESGPEEARI